MEKYFGIRYEFDKEQVWKQIDIQIASGISGYVCVADGVVVDHVQRNPEYRKAVNGSMFSICDSGWVPLYLKWIYGIRRSQYCGPMIFRDLVPKNIMMFFISQTLIPDTLKTAMEKKLLTYCGMIIPNR